uniref:Uncharacterized protein n=1 Tax=Haptolina brevifila TaxID=156173 RepID=A0A7S2G9W9_9EUKA
MSPIKVAEATARARSNQAPIRYTVSDSAVDAVKPPTFFATGKAATFGGVAPSPPTDMSSSTKLKLEEEEPTMPATVGNAPAKSASAAVGSMPPTVGNAPRPKSSAASKWLWKGAQEQMPIKKPPP